MRASPTFPGLLLALSIALPAASQDVVTVTLPPAIPTAEPQFVDDRIFTSAILNSTNTYRDQHSAAPLAWNETLESFATEYLDDNEDCAFEHSGGPYGENLAIGYPNATASVEAWGDERELFNFRRPDFDEDTGHFTQLVWKSTTTVGCGRKLCERGWYLVCEYWPRGNVIGQFDVEVGSQGSGPGSLGTRPGLEMDVLAVAVGAAMWFVW